MVCEPYEDLKHAVTCKLASRQYLPNQRTAILSLFLCYRDEDRKKITKGNSDRTIRKITRCYQ